MSVKYQLGLILSVSLCLVQASVNVTQDSELVMAFLVHRHGDRTPVSSDFSISNNPEALRKVVEKYGYGELTPRGKYRGYQVGQFIRQRYSFLSPQYKEAELYLRSTDITRTKMTALTSMAAVYPACKDNWSKDINWTPVPYTTVPMAMDYILAPFSCPKYIMYYTSHKPILTRCQSVLNAWSNITGMNLTDPLVIYTTYDLYYCQKSLGIPLSKAIEDLLPDIEKVAAAAMEVIFGNEEYLPLLSGVLLKEFFNSASELIKGLNQPRVRIYSAHDVNVYGMIAASRIQNNARPGVPTYGSIFGLELRKLKNGQYIVMPIYVKDPATRELIYLPIEGCSQPCDVRQFKKITKKFTLSQNTWERKCRENNFDYYNY